LIKNDSSKSLVVQQLHDISAGLQTYMQQLHDAKELYQATSDVVEISNALKTTHKVVNRILERLQLDVGDSVAQITQRTSVDPRISRIFIEELHADPQYITLQAELDDNTGFASDLSGAVDFLNLHFALEEAFHIKIADEDTMRFRTIGDIQSYLSARRLL
jgi:acyl carrier protein